MTATEGLGLSPARTALRSAFAADGRISVKLLYKVLDALEYTKLGRAADDPAGAGTPHFTFAHRRFQEYFATRVVLRTPDRVSVKELLTNGRWRETAVTILQTQPAEATGPVLTEAALLLAPMAEAATAERASNPDSIGFPWPPGSLHLLHLLDAGLGRAPENLGDGIRNECGRLLRAVWQRGRRHDQKWAVSVTLVADRITTIRLVGHAFESRSVYLGGAAYTVVSRMADPPAEMYLGVRQTLLDLAASGQLGPERVALRAQYPPTARPGPAVAGSVAARLRPNNRLPARHRGRDLHRVCAVVADIRRSDEANRCSYHDIVLSSHRDAGTGGCLGLPCLSKAPRRTGPVHAIASARSVCRAGLWSFSPCLRSACLAR